MKMQFIEQVIKMADANFHIFGIGSGTNDIHYIGWTQKSLSEEKEQIVSDLARTSSQALAQWISEALNFGKISIFEIESAPSMEDAEDSAKFWCQYYHSFGIDVVTDHS